MLPSHEESKTLSKEPMPGLSGGQFWYVLLTGGLWAVPGMVLKCRPQEGRKKCQGCRDGSVLVITQCLFCQGQGFSTSLLNGHQ